MGVDSWSASDRSVPRPARPAPRPAQPQHRTARQQPVTRRTAPAPGGPLGDPRGLTAAGAMVLLLVMGGVGATLDRLLGHNLWVLFAICFIAAALLAAARVHVEDLAASIVIVPLAYASVAAVLALFGNSGSHGLKQHLIDVAQISVLSAPVLLMAVAVAAAVALGRGRSVTHARRRAKARSSRRYGVYQAGPGRHGRG